MLDAENRLLCYIDRNPYTRFDSFDLDDRAIVRQMFRKRWIRQEYDQGFLRLTDAGRVELLTAQEQAQHLAQQQAAEDSRYRRRVAADRVYSQQDLAQHKRHDYAVAAFGALAAFLLDFIGTGNSVVHHFFHEIFKAFQ